MPKDKEGKKNGVDALDEIRATVEEIRKDLVAAEEAADIDAIARIKYGRIPEALDQLKFVEDGAVAQELAKRKVSLKAARVNAKKSIRDVSVALNVDPNTVSRWESDNRVPKTKYFLEMCDFYECSPDWIQQG